MGINVESRAGDVKLMSLNDIKLKSIAGQVRLESSSILMPLLPTATSSLKPVQSKPDEIFQLCVCRNGKLFLAPSHSVCAGSEEQVCR